MATNPLSPQTRSRRRHIGLLAGGLLLSALALAWLEAGPSIVVYNDTPEPITRLTIRVGAEAWAIDSLAPEESRRWRPPAGAAGELSVTAAGWDDQRPPVVVFPPARAGSLILRLGSYGTITSSTDRAWWSRLAEW